MPRTPAARAAGAALAALGITALALAAAPSLAVTVSGQVVDERGVGIFDVDLDFKDLSTGEIIFTPFDNTNAGGFYSVTVPVGDYDILFRSPSALYLDREIRDVTVAADTTINTFLEDAFAVTGVVVDGAALPVANVDLDFLDLASGEVLDTSQDFTQPNGTFQVYVADRTYDVFFTPPPSAPYAGKVVRDVTVTGPTNMGTITLQTGYEVHLRLVGNGGAPVANTDTDFEDLATGETIFTPRDNSDANGDLRPRVPAGTYDIVAKPSAATGLAWKRIPDVVVAGAVDLGNVQLLPGFAVTGVVRDEGAAPVAGADLDMVEVSTGIEIPTVNDGTTATGTFSLLSHATTLDVVVKPPAGAPLAAAIVRNVAVSGPTNLGTITLPAGFPVTGVVRDVWGAPVEGADLDAFEAGSGLKHPTPGDDTDAAGAYAIRLPAGGWTLVATPPAGSGLLPRTQTVTLTAPAVVDFLLPSATVDAPVVASGARLALHPATPNPFRGATRIEFDLPRRGEVRLVVLDVAGRAVRELVRGTLPAGRHDVSWNGRDDAGRPLAAGVYFTRLETPGLVLGGKAALLR